MFPGSRAGKTYLIEKWLAEHPDAITLYIDKKPPHRARKVIRGEVIRPELEAGSAPATGRQSEVNEEPAGDPLADAEPAG